MKQALLGCGFAAMLMTNAEATCKNKIISSNTGETNIPVSFKASLPLFVAANQGLSEYVHFQIPENDFFGISQYTSSAYDNVKTFVIEDGIKYKDMLDKFKWELSQWSIKHYGGVGTASKALDVDSKTIRNWRRRWANR